MSDVGVDELFKDVEGELIKAKYSRLFCDVERFRDDAREPMARYGEGVIYTKTYDGIEFHRHDEQYRKRVMAYYDEYHNGLDRAAKRILDESGELLILDCHSFSDKMASHFYKPPFPDVCIGVEKNYCDNELIEKIIAHIREKGYTCMVNYPYSGSMVPNSVLSGSIKGKVTSIMIEVNKRIYL